MWPFPRRKTPAPEPTPPARGHWLTHMDGEPGFGRALLTEALDALVKALPRPAGVAMDDSSTGVPEFKQRYVAGFLPDALTGWFVSQGFIGYQTCALIAQNWLVDKALVMPARDAIRHGYDIHISGAEDPDGKMVERLRELDKEFRVRQNMREFVHMGRLFGVRVLLFRVESNDTGYYEKPFNIDGVTAKSYKGISQVDPYWCVPELDSEAINDPASMHFYEPTYWVIQGKKYHRSHLCIFRASAVPDLLKPQYQYGGVPVPQRIVERVYAAERTANEGPQLAMTKRLTAWKTDMAAFYANQEAALVHLQTFTQYRDNHGVKIMDTEDEITQHDTSLADLDATIMTQYQLVAAAAHVPATKLLGTTPKGFSATGEYDESSYHEELEAIQADDLTPFLDRHYAILLRAAIEPENGVVPGTLTVNVDWNPVDSPTGKEYAEINKLKAETDALHVVNGAIDGMDVRNRLKTDKYSEYTGLAEPEAESAETILAEAMGNGAEETPLGEEPADVGGPAGRRGLPGQAALASGVARGALPGAAR